MSLINLLLCLALLILSPLISQHKLDMSRVGATTTEVVNNVVGGQTYTTTNTTSGVPVGGTYTATVPGQTYTTTYETVNQPVVSTTGYTTGYTTVPGQTYTTTSNVVGGSAAYATVPGQTYTTTYETVNQPAVVSSTYNTGGAYTSGIRHGSGVAHRAVAEEIPVESRIEYIPFEKKYVEYEQVEKVYQIPIETEVLEYEEVVHNERVPIEKTITDYYAVETQVEYIKKEIEETIMIEEPVERVSERVQYIPVETQIVHYPERDNYVAAATKTRTEHLGVMEHLKETRRVEGGVINAGQTSTIVAQPAYQTQQVTYETVAQPVATGYTTTTSNVYGNTAAYTVPGQTYTTTTETIAQPVATGYTTSNVVGTTGYTTVPGQTYTTTTVPGQTYTTTTGGYVTGGSGVRGSGVRNVQVTSGSGVHGSGVRATGGTGVIY